MWSNAADSLVRFRFWFALVWITYDAADLIWGGTRDILWTTGASPLPLQALQAALIGGELCILLGISAPAACLACFALRLAEAQLFFGLNDFYFYCVMILPLAFAGENLAWPRKFLAAQVAWIYAATATLKLNPAWLSGGHLFVRQNYLAAIQGWPYPAWYRSLFLTLPGCAWLAQLGAGAEVLLALLMLSRRGPRLATALAFGVHGFAALTVNVWFFGVSMVLSVAFLSGQAPNRELTGNSTPRTTYS